MGIYIEGMEMPHDCFHCKLRNGTWCYAASKWLAEFDRAEEMKTKRSEICTLVPVEFVEENIRKISV